MNVRNRSLSNMDIYYANKNKSNRMDEVYNKIHDERDEFCNKIYDKRDKFPNRMDEIYNKIHDERDEFCNRIYNKTHNQMDKK